MLQGETAVPISPGRKGRKKKRGEQGLVLEREGEGKEKTSVYDKRRTGQGLCRTPED